MKLLFLNGPNLNMLGIRAWAKMAGMDFPARSSMRRSRSRKAFPCRRARARPTVLLPHPGIPMRTTFSFPHLEGVLDVVYNPLRTALLLEARERGLPCSCGLPMLVAQAWRAEELFTGSASCIQGAARPGSPPCSPPR